MVSATSVGAPVARQPAFTPRHPRPTSCSRPRPSTLDDDLRKAAELILNSGFRQLPVIGADQKIAGFLEESEVTRAYLNLSEKRA